MSRTCVGVTQTHFCDVFFTLNIDIPVLIIWVYLQALATYLQIEIDLFVFPVPIYSSKIMMEGCGLVFYL